MSFPAQRRLLVFALMLVAAAVFSAGIQWGLPSRRDDAFLFGDLVPWSGPTIMGLAGERVDDPNRGANVPQHLLEHREQILPLNDTDADRAAIIRRYRLYSNQPDENTLLMALGRMRPATLDLDPKFYQYGGLFVYSVGAMLKLASVLHLIQLQPDPAFYIDHPEAFGRFYVVARSVAAMWGVIGVWAVFWIARRLSGGLWAPAAAALAYLFMPVVINQAHEAKPHLPAAVLMLMAVIAACRYVETGSRRYRNLTGLLSGAAFGTVLWALPVFLVIPLMTWLRRDRPRAKLRVILIAGVIGGLTYLVTNPYVAINLVRNRALLRSNLTNTTDMYRVGSWRQGVPNAAGLIGEGTSTALALVGAAATLAAMARRRQRSHEIGGRPALAMLLAAPAVILLVQNVAFAAGKPAEFGRFFIFPDIALGIAAITGAAAFARRQLIAAPTILLLLAATIAGGLGYERGFLRDTRLLTSRRIAARLIDDLAEGRSLTIAVWAEPAPYAVPPVDVFRHTLVLLPPGYVPPPGKPPADLLVRTEDAITDPPLWASGYERFVLAGDRPSRISWADKPIVIYVAPELP